MGLAARGLVVVTAALSLSACGAMQSVHWQAPGPGATDVISVDAQQRHLIMNYGEKGFRSCSEAAPDAFSAFGSSIGGELFGGGKAEAASALATTAATIERTQTYNLLRESFFRTCERWLSGAITEDQFATLAARDHRSMVAVLAIEQMTGVVKAPSTVISGPAVQAMLGRSEELIELLEKYRAERDAFEKPETEAKKAYDTVNQLVDVGGEKKKPLCEEETAPDAHKDEHAKCAELKRAYDLAKEPAERARIRESSVLKQLANLSVGIGASTSAGSTNFGGYDLEKNKISDLKMALIANSVEKIALTAGIDETLMFCTTYLGQKFVPLLSNQDTTKAMCNQVIMLRAQQDSKVAAEISGSDVTLIDEIKDLANDPQIVAAAKLLASRYALFRQRLVFALEATSGDQWDTQWQAFKDATGASHPDCTTLATCTAYVSDQGNRPFNLQYNDNPDEFDKAMDAWLLAVSDDPEEDD